jgi:hypothetical protein
MRPDRQCLRFDAGSQRAIARSAFDHWKRLVGSKDIAMRQVRWIMQGALRRNLRIRSFTRL